MQARVIGDILNYYTGERLPVVMAKVLRVKAVKDETELEIEFETSSDYVSGTFRYNDSVRHSLTQGAEVPIAIRFVFSSNRQMGRSQSAPKPVAVMAGLSADALDDPLGIMVYSLDARTL